MCGIAALVRTDPSRRAGSIDAVTDAVTHRGPDGRGSLHLRAGAEGTLLACGELDPWLVALGHRRLSILDLSDAALQPMRYRDRYQLVYNGELFNFTELRAELAGLGHAFATTGDSEVVLAAYAEWGPACFERFHGMWGLVLVDEATGAVVVSRDRLGIKPVYTCEVDGVLAIVSEPKQLRALPRHRAVPDRATVEQYLASGYEDADRTFLDGVVPFPPGCWARIDLRAAGTCHGSAPAPRLGAPQSYWDPSGIAPSITDPTEAGLLLREVMRTSVHQHLRSDVPVGTALSGGLDSSSIAAWCTAELEPLGQRLHTFSAEFPGHTLDETRFIDRVVGWLDAKGAVTLPDVDTFAADLDDWVVTHDEPVGSLSQYAAYAVARLTRATGVPVILNGQGGDEILAGYWQSYFAYLVGATRRGRLRPVAAAVTGAAGWRGNRELLGQFPVMGRRVLARTRPARWGLVEASGAGAERSRARVARVLGMDDAARRVFEIREMYLPQLLRWDDRNFMAFAVEGRYPFLDHAVIETALSFAPTALYRAGWVKEPLRLAAEPMLPHDIVRRTSKVGFETPQGAWLCGGLRPRVEAWLAGDSPVWSHADPALARALATQVWSEQGRNEERAQALMRAFLLDRWLHLCTD